MKEDFFEEQKEQSLVKSEILAKYFTAWSRVIIPWARKQAINIAYVDLYAGPGRYKDGTISTPLMVLRRAIESSDLKDMLVSIFNDANTENANALEKEIFSLDGIDVLRHKPQIYNIEVSDNLAEHFEKMRLVPTLSFIDPWGYKGLSLRLIKSVIKDWGSDCLFFFNYKRVCAGVSNSFFTDHINAIFGNERTAALKDKVEGMQPFEREMAIVNELMMALRENCGRYVLPFCFKDSRGSRTSHHIFFVSKHPKGYEIMKQIMAGYSSSHEQGVPSFTYNPVTEQYRQYNLLFELNKPIDALAEDLLSKYRGKTLTREQIYEEHNIDTPYIEINYKDALIRLEKEGKIKVDKPPEKRMRKGELTLGEKRLITFTN